jgi:hypothetical protein
VFRALETLVLAGMLALSFFAVPGAPDSGLDASWQEMLIHARSHGLQFGRDVVFTWGPWGFLCNLYHLGALEAVPILIWMTAGQFLVALALLHLVRALPLWRRLAFVACLLAFHWTFQDVEYFALITLIGISGLMDKCATTVRLLAWTLALGFLSHLKFTYLVISAAAAFAAMACWAGRGSWARTVAIGCGYTLSLVAAWAAAGQHVMNLPAYLRSSFRMAAAYGDAMGLDEPWGLFAWGSAVAILCALFAWRVWRSVPERPLAVGASGFLAFTFFVMWKESFTRADLIPLGGHVLGLFTLVLILAPVLPGLLFPGRGLQWFDGMVPLCLVAIACFDPALYGRLPRVAWERIYGNSHAIARLGSLPSEWQSAYEESCRVASLPRIRAAVSQGTVDVYDFETGAALLNHLNLSSRPIFQGYAADSAAMEELNLGFYRSRRAPEFLLWNEGRVDNRVPGLDDGALVAALAGHYEPLFPERGTWLFRRKAPLPAAPVERKLLLGRKVRLSEEVVLPPERNEALWLQARASPNTLGRLRALAYKQALINIVTTDDNGGTSTWRLVPATAEAGFLLVPTLAHGVDAASLLLGETNSWIRSFRFEAPAGEAEFWSHVDVSVYGLPGIPLRSSLGLPWLVDLGIVDRQAVLVTSVVPQQVIDVPEGRALLLHAEGEVMLDVPAGATRFAGSYGIREGAYSSGGHTAGVVFELEGIWPSGIRRQLWRRLLDPVAREEDRGTQHLDEEIPPDGPAAVVLHTRPAKKDDNRWDWSYVSALHFEVMPAK